jgi:PAS domain S-box-containing protein
MNAIHRCCSNFRYIIFLFSVIVIAAANFVPAFMDNAFAVTDKGFAASKISILAASEIDYPPFSIVDDDDNANGFSVELMQAALSAMGRNVTFRTGLWTDVREWLEQGEVQALPLVGRTPEREYVFDFTFPYMSLHGAIVVRNDTSEIKRIEDLKGRKVAVMRGDNAEEFLRREDRGIEIEVTSTFQEALRALSEGWCDAVVIQRLVALRLMQENDFANLRIVDEPVDGFRQDFCFAVQKGDYETLAILNEGLALVMADGNYRHLHAKWFAALELPANRRIVIGGDHNYPPFEYLDEHGKPAGFNVDLTRAIAREAGLDIEIRLGSWPEVLKQLALSEIDAVQGLLYSAQRDLSFNFSPPHTVIHYVGIVRKGEGEPPANAESLLGKKIIVQESDILHEFLVEMEMMDQVTLVDSQEAALRELSEGRHDYALVARLSALELIKRHGWNNLIVGNHPLLSPGYSYAVPQHHKALLARLGEGLKMIEKSGEYRRIYNKWFGIHEESSIGVVAIFRYAAIFATPLIILLFTIFFWSWSLRKQVARHTADLRESANLLRIAGQLAHLGGWRVNLSDNRLIWSDVVARIHEAPFEFSPSVEEAILYFAPEYREKLIEAYNACASKGESFDQEMEIITFGGKRVWVRTIGIAEHDKSGNIVAVKGALQDITERKLAEDKLRESESRFRLFAELAPVGIAILDHQDEIIYASRKFTELFGYTSREVSTVEQWWKHAYPDKIVRDHSREIWDRAVNEARLTNSEVSPMEYPITCKDGTVRQIEFRLAATETLNIVVFTDVTARKKAERELRKREGFLNKIFDVLPVGLWLTDQNGMILRGNPAGMEIWGAETGVPMETFKARRLPSNKEIVPEDSALARTIRQGITVKDEMLEILAFDGRKKIILNYTAPVLDDNGHMLGAIVVNQDITERIVAEKERKKLQEQLNHAQKMESVGRLAGGVAHDFNNMLTIINGYAEMMTELLSPSDPMYANVQEIHNAGKRSAIIVRKLLAFARKQTISPVVMNLNDSVTGMLRMLQRLIGENIELLWKPGRDLWLVKMDHAQIDQILANLMVNARDAISDVGKVIIETKNIVFDEEYCTTHKGFVPGQFVMLAVSDNGCGMNDDVMQNLFEPFFTTKEVGKGTGLGLPTVYGIVKQNNAFINVYSESGMGTTFKIFFPRSMSDTADAYREAAKPAPNQSRFGETILILEDEIEILAITRIMLEKSGYNVLTAGSATEAMALVEAYGNEIRLLITDIVMPDMNGRDFADQLLRLYPEIKILYMSGYTAHVIAHHHVIEKGLHFIEKPFSLPSLAAKVHEVLTEAV